MYNIIVSMPDNLFLSPLLQTMMLEKWRVCQKMEGESNFLVFSQMLAGLSTEMRYTHTRTRNHIKKLLHDFLSPPDRTELQMHQFPEANSFGIVPPIKVTRTCC
jgi:hypothetical protein